MSSFFLAPLAGVDPVVLSDLHASCFVGGDVWSRNSFADLLADPMVFGTQLLEEGETLGFVMGRGVANEAEILTFAVSPRRRRLGLGATLMADFLKMCRMRGMEDIHLEVAADNQAARGLYLKSGFQDVGRRPRYYANGADAILMKQILSLK